MVVNPLNGRTLVAYPVACTDRVQSIWTSAAAVSKPPTLSHLLAAELSRVPSSKCLREDTALTGALPGDPFESGCRRSVEAKNFTSADVSFGAMQQPL